MVPVCMSFYYLDLEFETRLKPRVPESRGLTIFLIVLKPPPPSPRLRGPSRCFRQDETRQTPSETRRGEEPEPSHSPVFRVLSILFLWKGTGIRLSVYCPLSVYCSLSDLGGSTVSMSEPSLQRSRNSLVLSCTTGRSV